jgi:hypothetical protein
LIAGEAAEATFLGRLVEWSKRSDLAISPDRTSSVFLVAPRRFRRWQHGHTVTSGSSTCSQRGRCLGSAPSQRAWLAVLLADLQARAEQ